LGLVRKQRACTTYVWHGHEALNLPEHRPYLTAPRLALFQPDSPCADLAADIVHQSASTKVGRYAIRAHLFERRVNRGMSATESRVAHYRRVLYS